MGYVKKNPIGLSEKDTQMVVAQLNELLASYQIVQMNVKGFHWNIKGPWFFVLHEQFGALYDDLSVKIDELAERIVAYGTFPYHSFEEYLKYSGVDAKKNIIHAKETVEGVTTDLRWLLQKQRRIVVIAQEAEDEGTVDLLAGYIRDQEKQLWKFQSFLQETIPSEAKEELVH